MTKVDKGRIGVVLLNMGGPDTLDDVQPFLCNLFSDRNIIRLGPRLLQKPLARLIARKRAPKSRENYGKIGGGSPLKSITLNQAKALQEALRKDGDFFVSVAMRYWSPRSVETVTWLQQQKVERIIALPLYPHYSRATTGSSVQDLVICVNAIAPSVPYTIIKSYPSDPFYITALAESIKEGISEFSNPDIQLVYSAHSLPESFIDDGDPYVEHLKITITEVEKLTGFIGKLCYQSRSGPVKWLEPSTPEMIAKLASEGCKNILMVPISFVSDHIETLYEIRQLYKEQAAQLGMTLVASPSLNCRPMFIEALRHLVLQSL